MCFVSTPVLIHCNGIGNGNTVLVVVTPNIEQEAIKINYLVGGELVLPNGTAESALSCDRNISKDAVLPLPGGRKTKKIRLLWTTFVKSGHKTN